MVIKPRACPLRLSVAVCTQWPEDQAVRQAAFCYNNSPLIPQNITLNLNKLSPVKFDS